MTRERFTETCAAKSPIVQPGATGTHSDTDRAWYQKICATLLSEWNTCRSAAGLLWLAQLVGAPPSIIETARASVTSEFGSAHCADQGGDRVRQLISVDVVTMALAAVRSPSTAGCGASAPSLVTG